jgi:Asp-tRNA(Asn)/Glu-tRNA(Gln) amidotransferase A subunit family amidase
MAIGLQLILKCGGDDMLLAAGLAIEGASGQRKDRLGPVPTFE